MLEKNVGEEIVMEKNINECSGVATNGNDNFLKK